MSAVTLPVDHGRPAAKAKNRKSRRFAFCPVLSRKLRRNLGNPLPSYYVAGDGVATGSRSLRDRTGRTTEPGDEPLAMTKSNYYDSICQQQIFRWSYGGRAGKPAWAGHDLAGTAIGDPARSARPARRLNFPVPRTWRERRGGRCACDGRGDTAFTGRRVPGGALIDRSRILRLWSLRRSGGNSGAITAARESSAAEIIIAFCRKAGRG
jgi:hypothetical protein